jgi:hypothetical protein
MKKLLVLVTVLLATSVTALAADVTGTWSGTLIPPGAQGEASPDIFAATLKQADSKITGTVGPTGQQMPITEGTIKDNKVTLTIAQATRTLTLDLTLDGDRMTGTASRIRNGVADPEKAKVELVKAK